MPEYRPAWRRPIAETIRRTARSAAAWCVRRKTHPNLVSCSSIAASTGAGLCFGGAGAVPVLLVPAVALCYLRLWLNMLDGMAALASGKASANCARP